MWRAEAGLKDWAGTGRAPRAGQALQAGGPEAQVGQGLERPAAERGTTGSRPEMEAGRGKVQQGSGAGSGREGRRHRIRFPAFHLAFHLAGGRAGERAGPGRARPVSPHGGAHGLACRGPLPLPQPSPPVFTRSQNP